MTISGFFGKYKHKKFNYIPRYYDPQKEDLEERIRNIERKMGVKEGEAYRPTIRKGQMTNYFNWKTRKSQKRSNIRLIVILLVLFFIAYLFIYN